MTPAARYAAALDVLSEIQSDRPAEQALTRWARGNRYAGSKDRAAVRDHVYDVLRQRESCAALGGGHDALSLVLGLLKLQDIDPQSVFGVGGYAPDALPEEKLSSGEQPTARQSLNLPDWIADQMASDWDDEAQSIALALQSRAPVFLRVALRNGTREQAIKELAQDGVVAIALPDSETALKVTEGARRVALSGAYTRGLVEIQDASSQRAIASLPLAEGMRVLDYCAGGGGKALAMADAIGGVGVDAHDANPQRMKDIVQRAERAGVRIPIVENPEGFYDLVVCDVPCSGSGTWRRAPEAKWQTTRETLENLCQIQRTILQEASNLVRPDGYLAYFTCSVLRSENSVQIQGFVAGSSSWSVVDETQILPSENGDGFYFALLKRV